MASSKLAAVLAVLAVGDAFQVPFCAPNSVLISSSRFSHVGRPAARSLVGPKMIFGLEDETTKNQKAWSPAGINVKEFFDMSVGTWKCLRSSHNIAFGHVEEVNTDLTCVNVPDDDPDLNEILKIYKVDMKDVVTTSKVSWEGYSDWDDKEVKGSSVFAVIEDEPGKGRLLRSKGYAEEIPSVGQWEMRADGEFVLDTMYAALAANERFIYVTPDMRMRLSNIKTQGGKGMTTASLSTEIRQKGK